jgi:hypothetical protein
MQQLDFGALEKASGEQRFLLQKLLPLNFFQRIPRTQRSTIGVQSIRSFGEAPRLPHRVTATTTAAIMAVAMDTPMATTTVDIIHRTDKGRSERFANVC